MLFFSTAIRHMARTAAQTGGRAAFSRALNTTARFTPSVLASQCSMVRRKGKLSTQERKKTGGYAFLGDGWSTVYCIAVIFVSFLEKYCRCLCFLFFLTIFQWFVHVLILILAT